MKNLFMALIGLFMGGLVMVHGQKGEGIMDLFNICGVCFEPISQTCSFTVTKKNIMKKKLLLLLLTVYSSLLIFSQAPPFNSETDNSSSSLLGEWEGQMSSGAGYPPFTVTLKIECEKNGSYQGRWFHKCPQILPCNCGFQFRGIFSSKIYDDGTFKFETVTKEGDDMCGHFTATLFFDKNNGFLSGRTSGGFSVRLQKRRNYGYSECTQVYSSAPKPSQQPIPVPLIEKTCRTCKGTGYKGDCSLCEGGYNVIWVNGVYHHEECTWQFCENGKERCNRCYGKGTILE